MKTARVILFTILLVQSAQGQFYFSPGFQFGYSSDKKFFTSYQITFGSLTEIFPSDEYPMLPSFPGVTFGIRRFKDREIVFTDFQLHSIYIGIGVGYATETYNYTIDYVNQTGGFRGKIWAGAFLNGTYDFIKHPNQAATHNFGLILVVPFLDIDSLLAPLSVSRKIVFRHPPRLQ